VAAAFGWSDRYSVNIAELDQQHQRLFRLMDELNRALAAGRSQTALDEILRKLVEYTIVHFATEEHLMDQHGFPGFSAHRLEHNVLTEKITSLRLQHRAGKPDVAAALVLFLQHWMEEHILKTDKQYSQFLNAKGVL
jgi:hemerythrin